MHTASPTQPLYPTAAPASSDPAQLVARVYAESDGPSRARLLESLMRPLGALSLVAVAGGTFAALRQRNGWDSLRVTLEDTVRVNAGQVQDLAAYLMQSAPDALSQLADVVGDNPLALSSLSALLLMQTLRAMPQRQAPRWLPGWMSRWTARWSPVGSGAAREAQQATAH